MSRTIWLAVAAAALAACAGQREGGQARQGAGASGGAQTAQPAGGAAETQQPPAGAGPADGGRERSATADAGARRESCLDAWLAQRGLNAYGDPPGTMYMGGTPLFDEATGERRDRVAYLIAKLPELAKACP